MNTQVETLEAAGVCYQTEGLRLLQQLLRTLREGLTFAEHLLLSVERELSDEWELTPPSDQSTRPSSSG